MTRSRAVVFRSILAFVVPIATLWSCDATAPPNPEVSAIKAAPSTATVPAINRKVSLELTATDQNGNAMPTPTTIQWASSDVSVAAVDQSGKVTALKDGNAIITATFTPAVKTTASIQVRAAIDIKAFVSAMVNPGIGTSKDTIAVKVTMTDKP
jgi:uncharacterized protein YjdB